MVFQNFLYFRCADRDESAARLSAFKRKNIFDILLHAEKEKWASKIHFCEDASSPE
jgi:hypothetical protein